MLMLVPEATTTESKSPGGYEVVEVAALVVVGAGIFLLWTE
jgi:hypothetical protein